jgi:hypothetical protein
MKSAVTIRGYTNAILVLNMKRFINKDDQPRFERIRGTREFAQVLRDIWPKLALSKSRFETSLKEKQHRNVHDEMTTEEIGFATGVFRSLALEDLTFPTYSLNKDSIQFPSHLMANYQFKNLFLRAWRDWQIFIRPTFTGMFVIRLLRQYTNPTPLPKVGQDAIELQESLDVQSARKRLIEIRKKFANDPAQRRDQEDSVLKFLAWLGADETTPTRLLYAPVQWKLAMEVCNLFVEDVSQLIQLDPNPIKLAIPEASLSYPLHDSYIAYHIDEMWSSRKTVLRDELADDILGDGFKQSEFPQAQSWDHIVPVRPLHIRKSKGLQHQIAGLIEGSMLRRPKAQNKSGGTEEGNADERRYFPRLESELVHNLFKQDVATWEDELCILTARTAILIPSYKSKKDDLLIATLPKATSNFPYLRYWGGIERMIEFIIEIRVLAQLLERASFNLLEELAKIMSQIRSYLFSGDIRLHERLPDLIEDAAHLRRLAALCQGLSNPQVWSRAEYAIRKATHLLEQLNVPTTLTHIERNIISINSVADHVDEWYMADLAEQSNDMGTLLSLGLAAASFILTLLILPSFWADLEQVNFLGRMIKALINYAGSTFAIVLIAGGAALTGLSLRYGNQIIKIMNRSLFRLRKTFEGKDSKS